jgi:5-methylcytosine-specific restriction protein B
MENNYKKIEQLISLVQGRYPGWEDFSDETFKVEEITYKEEASRNAKEILSKEILNAFLESKDYQGFIESLERVAQSTNLLYLGAPRTGDLSILYQEDLDKGELCQTIFQLLYGEGPINDRFQKYLDFIQKNDASFKWTFPTYFLYLLFPETEIILKPSTTRWFLDFIESEIKYSNKTDLNIYTTFRGYAAKIKDTLKDLNPKSMMDIQAMLYIAAKVATGEESGVVSIQKRKEFKRLFEEFIQDYPKTQAGKDHIKFYRTLREEAEQNYKCIAANNDQGEDITDEVLLKLLPYSNSENNRKNGAWTHIAPAIQGNIKTWYENVGWQKSEDWPLVSKAIFKFMTQCLDDPDSLDDACRDFSDSPYSKGLQTGMLTPFLNAINPEEFILINNKSRYFYNYFSEAVFSKKLVEYPELNATAKQLILEVGEDISATEDLPDLNFSDLLDMFSHWLKAIKKFKYFGVDDLAEPFSKMFSDRDQADWVFDWVAQAAGVLGIENENDPLSAFTLRHKQGIHSIRLDYGSWLILGFGGKNQSLDQVYIALFANDYGLDPIGEGIFSQPENEQPIHLYTFSYEEFLENEVEISNAFLQTLEIIRRKFSHWRGSPYNRYSISQLGQAVFNIDVRNQILTDGLNFQDEETDVGLEGVVRYWKISPGENAWNWNACRDGGFIAIGWDELGDLSNTSQEEFEILKNKLAESLSEYSTAGMDQVWKFRNINIGDIVIANQGTTKVLGVGRITGDYSFTQGVRHGHQLPVEWFDLQEKEVNEGGWRRTLIEIDKQKFDQLNPIEISDHGGAYTSYPSDKHITIDTFSLLNELHQNPTKDFYAENKTRFKRYLFDPIKLMYSQVAQKLPFSIREILETEKKLFSQINKNDFGKGGAYDFFWGAFYSKGANRAGSPQLSIWINKDRLEFGFYIGVYGKEYKQRFIKNCVENNQKLLDLLKDSLAAERLIFGSADSYDITPAGEIVENTNLTFEEFLKNPESADFNVTYVLPRTEVLEYSNQQLIDLCLETYLRVYPLILLAMYDNPLPLINEFLEMGLKDDVEINPLYTLEQCAQETYLGEEQIARWVSAIERKGQAILFGPPGTGKTFIAEHLARHLIGGGDGFIEFVQFHPSYAYEDFMQGIRPKTSEDGKYLVYPLVPGRFVDFCKEVRLRDGKCVLIIDEINRANLSRVFGELMYLLEYRNREIPLSGGGVFRIPENVFILGTMNTADRSIALVDHALRRRFAFLELGPKYEILERFYEDKSFNPIALIEVLKDLNKQIADKNFEIGISFFIVQQGKIQDYLEDIWRMEIEPYLEEYFFDQPEKVNSFRWDRIEGKLL